MVTPASRNVVIIGGGISGLSSAFYVLKYGKERGIDLNVTLVEKDSYFGGKIMTLHRDGFVIEKGPDSFLARKMPMIDLARELDLEEELVPTNPIAKQSFIMHHGKLHKMPPGLALGIPTKIRPFLSTGLISLKGKMRAAMDFVLPKRTEPGDESLGAFLTRRLGPEVLDNIAEPLLAGIYAGDTFKLSLQATFPQFAELEQKHGSLIRGMKRSKNKQMNLPGQPGVAKNSMFLTFRQGLQTLVHALIHELNSKIAMLSEVEVTSIERHGADRQGGSYTVHLDRGEALQADAIIVAVPTFAAAKLLQPYVNVSMLEAVRYISVANVVMAFDAKDITAPFPGSGFLVPRKEKRNITACTWTSTKWPHTTPEGKVLLRCYVGREGDEQNVDLPDEQLAELVRMDLRDIMGIAAEPLFTEITRLKYSMPQYPVGHLQAIAKLRAELKQVLPGIEVTGSGFEGVGLPDCIRQGRDAASQVLSNLS